MLVKDYRICMPLSVAEYQVGQLYMISKHSHEQSEKGEGVEVVSNEPYEDPIYGQGQYTEKRIHLSSKLPGWAQAVVPRIFYVTEKAWNYYPHTITEFTFSIYIKTKYEDNNGQNDNVFEDEEVEKEVVPLDIAFDELPERYYKESEDPRKFQSWKTQRGPLCEGWRDTFTPIMCSYKLTTVKFEVWGLQTRVEQFVHKAIRDILLAGHRQAFAWIDEWHDMTMEDVREFERVTQEATNSMIGMRSGDPAASGPTHSRSQPSSAPNTPLVTDAPEFFLSIPKDRQRKCSAPETLTLHQKDQDA